MQSSPQPVQLFTAIIVPLVSAVGGALVGGYAVWKSQTRELALRERAAANAVLVNLDGIIARLETLVPGDEGMLYDFAPPPRIHEWVRPLVAQLAARNASVLGALIELEPRLDHHHNLAQSARSFANEVDRSVAEVARWDNEVARADGTPQYASTVANRLRAAEHVERSRSSHTAAITKWREFDATLRNDIARLRARLTEIASTPVAESLIDLGPDSPFRS